MKLNVSLDYAAPPAQVVAMLCDEDFQARLCEATHSLESTVDVHEEDEDTVVTTTRQLPTDGFPDFLRSVVGQSVRVVQTSRWAHGATGGHVHVVVEGTPVRMDATATITSGGGRTSVTYAGDLVAHVPFVGGRVEKAAAPVVMSALRAEQRVGDEWLRTH